MASMAQRSGRRSFFNFSDRLPVYDPAAADAWARMLAFFAERLPSIQTGA